MENANTSIKNSTAVTRLLEAADSQAGGVGVKDGRQSDSLIRLIIRETGKSVQFQITAAEGGKVYVVGMLNKMDPTTRPLSPDPEIYVFRATLYCFGRNWTNA